MLLVGTVMMNRMGTSLKVSENNSLHSADRVSRLPSHPILPSADIISTVEFDHTGDYLATGDKGGRVVLFERNESVCWARQTCGAGTELAEFYGFVMVEQKKGCEYKFYTEVCFTIGYGYDSC